MKFGCEAITWGSDLNKAIEDVSKLGYSGIETFMPRNFENRPQDFKEYLESRNLQLSSLYFNCSFIDNDIFDLEFKEAEKVINFLKVCGAGQMIVGGGRKRLEGNREEDYQKFYQNLNRLGKMCRDNGIEACFHPHFGSMVETSEQLDNLMDNTDPELLYLAPDTGHLVMGGADAVQVFYIYIDRIKYVHLKDFNGKEFIELGEGTIHFPSIMDMLKMKEYDGWIVVELDTARYSAYESALISRQYLKNCLGIQISYR